VLTISPAEPADVHALTDLMEDLDRFYGVTEFEPLTLREEQIREQLFGSLPVAYALLAKDGSDLVAFASYSFLWPAAGVTRSLFLKELYVRQERYREGIGRQLMRAVCDIAVAEGCSRVEWQTDVENTRAQQFYKALGAPVHTGKVFYRLDGDDLRRVAEEPGG
jgi:GNAT superfamily N-acetyltransferase